VVEAKLVGPYDTWQALGGICVDEFFLDTWHFVANGLVTRGPSKGHHVSPRLWIKLV
jgi:hypothetical protein